MLHADFEILYIHSDLALIDVTLVLRKEEFDGVLQRQDVLVVAVVDPVQHGGNRRALAGTGHARQQDHSLIELAEFLHYRREMKAREVGNDVVHEPGDQPEASELLQQIDAEPPFFAVAFHGIREVRAAIPLENRLGPLVQQGHAKAAHLLAVDRSPVQRPQRAADANTGRKTDPQVQIASTKLDQRDEQPVDLQYRARF